MDVRRGQLGTGGDSRVWRRGQPRPGRADLEARTGREQLAAGSGGSARVEGRVGFHSLGAVQGQRVSGQRGKPPALHDGLSTSQ